MFMLSYTSCKGCLSELINLLVKRFGLLFSRSIMCLGIDDCSSKECCHTDIDDAVPGTDGETRVQSLLVFL